LIIFQNKYLFTSVERSNPNLDDLKKELSDFWKTQDENGNTLLHLACSQGNEDAIKELLKVDEIDVTSKNNDGKIALELIKDKDLKSSIYVIVSQWSQTGSPSQSPSRTGSSSAGGPSHSR